MSSTNKLKIVAIICFAFIIMSELIAYVNPEKGYESSIYAQTPVFVWIFLIGSMIGGLVIIVHQAVADRYKNYRFWLIGLLITVLAQEVIFYLPYIRGYLPCEGTDTTKHIIKVTGIVSSGHFMSDNFYPITHILLSEIILITGIQKLTVVIFSSAFVLITYVCSIYMLSTVVSPKIEQRLLVIAAIAGMPFILNIYTSAIFPVYWSASLIPLLFFFFLKRFDMRYSILFVIFLILIPFFHIFSSFVIIIFMIIYELSKIVYVYIPKYEKTVIQVPNLKSSLNSILVELAIFITWIFSFHIFDENLREIFNQMLSRTGTNVMNGMTTRLDKINVHGFGFVQLLFQMYGTMIIFIFLSLIAMFILIKQIRLGNDKKETQSLFSLLCVYLSFYFMYLLYILGAPGLSSIAGNRMLYIAPLLSPIFAGFCFNELLKNVYFKRLASICIICIILFASVFTIFSYYSSPYIKAPNAQVTKMDMAGMTWFIEQKDTTIGHVYIANFPGKYVVTILGETEASKRPDVFNNFYYPSLSEFVPDHFNYTNHNLLGESYAEDKYIVISKYDRLLYNEVWKEVGRFNYTDFNKLEWDTSVNKLYSNNELDTYLIYEKESN